ncbi:hypothetical protein [Streptomyces muensis]|nr:hypothetical protein [Streptomyces muensis]
MVRALDVPRPTVGVCGKEPEPAVHCVLVLPSMTKAEVWLLE